MQASKSFMQRLLHDITANTLAIAAASLMPLLAMVGGGIDASRYYMAQARLQKRCDALDAELAAAARARAALEADAEGAALDAQTLRAKCGELQRRIADAEAERERRFYAMGVEGGDAGEEDEVPLLPLPLPAAYMRPRMASGVAGLASVLVLPLLGFLWLCFDASEPLGSTFATSARFVTVPATFVLAVSLVLARGLRAMGVTSTFSAVGFGGLAFATLLLRVSPLLRGGA
jgi:hypothetical protein